MTDLPKRELGRTAPRVTMLGYGAMEPRGAAKGAPSEGKQSDERNGCRPQQRLSVAVHNRAQGIGDGVKGS
jgi:hypothetical protein